MFSWNLQSGGKYSLYNTNKLVNIQGQIIIGAMKQMNWCLKVLRKKVWAELCGFAKEEKAFIA